MCVCGGVLYLVSVAEAWGVFNLTFPRICESIAKVRETVTSSLLWRSALEVCRRAVQLIARPASRYSPGVRGVDQGLGCVWWRQEDARRGCLEPDNFLALKTFCRIEAESVCATSSSLYACCFLSPGRELLSERPLFVSYTWSREEWSVWALDITWGLSMRRYLQWASRGPESCQLVVSYDAKPQRPGHYEVHHARWEGHCAPRIVNNKSIAHLSFGLGGNKFFGRERSTFPIQMNRSISPLSWGLLASEQGGEGAETTFHLPLLTHFFFPCVLSPFVAHLFPALANTRSASKASVCLFVSFSRLSTTPPTSLSCGAFVIQRRGGGRGERLERRIASTVPHWWYFVFKWGGRMFLPKCCWCWTGLAGGLYLVPLCPWTNLKAAQQLVTMGECRYKRGLVSLSLHSVFSFLWNFYCRLCGGYLLFVVPLLLSASTCTRPRTDADGEITFLVSLPLIPGTKH